MRFAFGLSLLLHVLLLWPAPDRRPDRSAPGALQATMRPLPVQALEIPKVPPKPLAAAPRQSPVAPVAPATQVYESPKALVVPSAGASVAEAERRPAPVATAASVSPAPAVVAGAPAAAGGSGGENPDGLRAYRIAVATQAKRFKRYPAEAMAAGHEGSAEVRLDVGSDGQPRPAAVVRSSGHEALDRAALAMIDAGAPRARLPESLRGRTFSVQLPVVFNLDEQ